METGRPDTGAEVSKTRSGVSFSWDQVNRRMGMGEGTHLQPSAPPAPANSTPAVKKVAKYAAEQAER